MVISAPSACTASTEQLLTETPSISTVHAPQLEVSHPIGRTGLAEHVPEVVNQQQPGLYLIDVADAVDGYRYLHSCADSWNRRDA